MTKARERYNAAVEKRKRAEAAIAEHGKTYCPETMTEEHRVGFCREDGARVDWIVGNPKYDPKAYLAYIDRGCELDKELAKCKDEESRAFFLLQIIEAPLTLIRFVRWCFKRLFGFCKRIEQETRPE